MATIPWTHDMALQSCQVPVFDKQYMGVEDQRSFQGYRHDPGMATFTSRRKADKKL